MAKSSRLELHEIDSEDLGILDSDSLPSEPPDLRKWFSSYVYESPELDDLCGFQDTNGKREARIEEENTGEFGNNHHPVSQFAEQVKSSQMIESDGSDDSETAAMVPGLSESLMLSAEPPDLKNWFSSYTYESPPLDTALDFAISVCEEREDDKFCVVKESESQNLRDPMASIDVTNKKLCTLTNSSDAKGPNLVKCTKLDYESMCKGDDEEDVVTLRPLLSKPSLSSLDKVSNLILSGQKAGHSSHRSLEKIASTNAHGNDCDAILPSEFCSRNPVSLNRETHIGSQDGKSVFKPIEGTDHVKDDLGKEDIGNTVSPRTTDKIVAKRDSWGSPADRRRSMGKGNEENELLEDGFISIRKKSRHENAENMSRLGIGVETRINYEKEKDKDTKMVRKVLSEISNFHSQNILGSTGKWSCPQKNKPDLGPPLKQLRLDQWVRHV